MDRLCNARNVIIEMFKYRGYDVSAQVMPYNTFIVQYPNALGNPTILNFATGNTSNQIVVHFTYDEKLSKQSLDTILANYVSQGVDTLLLLTVSKLNAACRVSAANSKLRIEHFMISEVQANISKHTLVIPHRIMTQDQAEEIMKKYKLDKDKIPAILTTDMMCRFIGGKVGDMVELKRKSETAGQSIYYRIVKNP